MRPLESIYGYKRGQMADILQRLFEGDRFRLESSALAWRTMACYRAGTDFADALSALRAGCNCTASFDREAPHTEPIRLLAK